jgi:hypothetical protein
MNLLLLLLACPAAPDDSVFVASDTGIASKDSGQVTRVPGADWPEIVINEFQASNRTTVSDGTGAFSDWIELFNASEAAVDLAGWTLSDNPDNPDDYELESLVLAPGETALFWADNEPRLGPGHMDFSLSKSGGVILLSGPDGTLVDQVTYPQQGTDVAAARSPDGGAGWVLTLEATPGLANADHGLAAADPSPPVGDCEPAGDLEQLWFLEGDNVAFHVACTGGLTTAETELQLLGLPEGAAFDDAELAFSWETGTASGGRHDLVFSVRPLGATDRVPAAAIVTFWVADNPEDPGNVAVDPLTYTEEWGLPVFHITHEGSLTESYTDGTTIYRGQTYAHEIKIRGAASVQYPKNSWTVKYDDPEIEVEDWGRSRDHLVFLTTFDDNSFVRQKFIYDLWEAMAEHAGEVRLTPRTFFAVVYLQGVYHGLYVVIDHVDNEFLDHFGLSRDANLYKSVNHDANFELTDYYGNRKSTLHAGYEKKEGDPSDDFSDLVALVDWSGPATAATILAESESWFPLPEFQDWFLLVYYSLSEDSAGKNAYLYNDPTQPTRFRYVPWDFNHAWGQNWYTARTSVDSLNDYMSLNRLFWAMQTDPAGSEALWARFDDLRENGPFARDWLRSKLDSYYAEIELSAQRDWQKWEYEYHQEWWAPYREGNWTTYAEEKTYLYDWLEGRADLFEVLVP